MPYNPAGLAAFTRASSFPVGWRHSREPSFVFSVNAVNRLSLIRLSLSGAIRTL